MKEGGDNKNHITLSKIIKYALGCAALIISSIALLLPWSIRKTFLHSLTFSLRSLVQIETIANFIVKSKIELSQRTGVCSE